MAEAGSELLGFIAFRDGKHLFNLFVAPHRQGRGIGRTLWQQALRGLPITLEGTTITVNGSLNAIPFYRALGFRQEGELAMIQGVVFVPMRWQPPR